MKKIKCDHCHLHYDEDILIKDTSFGDEKFFCCKGCQGIFHLLNKEGLDSFYEKMGSNTLEPPKEFQEDFDKFDMDGFKERYVTQKDGFSEISLVIEGIHCAACVWLNEKVLHRAEGVIEANINGSNHKAKVVWDDEVIKLSEIIRLIQSIGYRATPYDPSLQEEKANAKRRDYNARLLVAVFASMNIMWIAIAQYTGFFTGMRDDIKSILNFAEFVLASPALFYTGWVYFKGAYFGVKNRHINMDLLVATGASLVYLYSLYAMFSGHGEVYFDSVTMIVTFVFAGKYLEVLTQKKAVDTLDGLTSSLPTQVLVLENLKSKKGVPTPVENVQVGDIIELKAGDKAVIDGVLLSGEASFDESSITGEDKPVFKEKDHKITSGSICLDGLVYYEAKQTYKNSMLYKITNLLEESMLKKPKIEQLANQISGYFSLAILSLALLTFIGWMYYGGGFERSLIVAISVIVIACPCALGLATPVATLVGLGVAAKNGILFKKASYLESMAKSTILALDKTGTITRGKPEVAKEIILGEYDKNLLYSLLKTSSHPISKGVLEHLTRHDESFTKLKLEKVKAISSKGVEASYKGVKILGGNSTLMIENKVNFKRKEEGTSYWFAVDGKLVCGFLLEDKPKEQSLKAIQNIQALGIKTVMLTGDNEVSGQKIASKVGINNYLCSLDPLQKADAIDDMRKKEPFIVMAGDGVNDALALSKSDIAIAMGSGADVALNVSDVVILNNKITSISGTFAISKGVYKTIKQNLGFSVFYNLLTVPLAMFGFINPLFAALSMSLSSIVVVLNSMRIKFIKV